MSLEDIFGKSLQPFLELVPLFHLTWKGKVLVFRFGRMFCISAGNYGIDAGTPISSF
jgi:hypothetical protein